MTKRILDELLANKRAVKAMSAVSVIGCMGLLTLGAFWLVLPSAMFDWRQMVLTLPIHTLWLFGLPLFVGAIIYVGSAHAVDDEAVGIAVLASAGAVGLAIAVSWAVFGFDWTLSAYSRSAALWLAVCVCGGAIVAVCGAISGATTRSDTSTA